MVNQQKLHKSLRWKIRGRFIGWLARKFGYTYWCSKECSPDVWGRLWCGYCCEFKKFRKRVILSKLKVVQNILLGEK